MYRRIITVIIVIALLSCAAGTVSADNNTTNETEQSIDLSHYITADSINGNAVQFSDGYSGFRIDSGKNEVTSDDGFTSYPATKIDIGNYLKLTVIECYKQNKEKSISQIIEKFVDGSYKSSSDNIIQNVLKSDANVNDHEVVEINNNTEATFDFELLKPVNGATSQYFAYTVSFKTIPKEDKLTAGSDTNESSNTDTSNVTKKEDTSKETKTEKTDNTSKTGTDNKTEKTVNNKETVKKADDNKETVKNETSKKNNDDNDTEVHETNKTIINKTNTVVVNQKNTTIINQHNVKTINNTTNETPQNDTLTSLMRNAGNPIMILIIVIIIVAVVGVAYYKKD